MHGRLLCRATDSARDWGDSDGGHMVPRLSRDGANGGLLGGLRSLRDRERGERTCDGVQEGLRSWHGGGLVGGGDGRRSLGRRGILGNMTLDRMVPSLATQTFHVWDPRGGQGLRDGSLGEGLRLRRCLLRERDLEGLRVAAARESLRTLLRRLARPRVKPPKPMMARSPALVLRTPSPFQASLFTAVWGRKVGGLADRRGTHGHTGADRRRGAEVSRASRTAGRTARMC